MRLLGLIALGLPLLIAPLIVSAMGVSAARNEAYLVFAAVLNNDGDYGEFEFDPPTGIRHLILFVPSGGTINSVFEPGRWSPSGEWYAVSLGSALAVRNAEGHDHCRVEEVNAVTSLMVWSPEGDRLAYTDLVFDGSVHTLTLNLLDLARCEIVTHTLNIPSGTVSSIDWSPNGQLIAIAGGEIYFINYNGTDFRQLPLDGGTKTRIVWSPDGTRLAYANITNGIAVQIVTLNDVNIQIVASSLIEVNRVFWR